MTTLKVHTVDRTKTSMNSTLPDTLDIFEMQKRRHDLAFFSVLSKAELEWQKSSHKNPFYMVDTKGD